MRVLDLSCNQCGAALEVPRKANFVTCAFCNTRLRIQHTDTSAFTEVIDEMASDLESIRRDTAITRLDQEWMLRRERFQVRNKNGSTSMPSKAGASFMIGVALLGGLVAVRIAGAFGFVVMAIGVIGGLFNLSKASAYENARSRYRRRRRELMRG